MLGRLLYYLTVPFRKLMSAPMALLSAPRRVMGLSLPARAALLIAVLLITAAIMAIVVLIWTEDPANPINYFFRLKTWGAYALIVIIPIGVYYWIKLWLEGDPSRYPDIDAAWKEGLQTLEKNGLDISSIPIFLVLGVPDEKSASSLFRAAGFSWTIRDVPPGHTPLRWYANEKAIFLVSIDTCRLSKLNQLGGLGQASGGGGSASRVRGTLESTGDVRGTLASGGGIRQTVTPTLGGPADEETGFGGGGIRGTLVPGGGGGGGGGAASAAAANVSLPRQEADEQSERLRYLCQLLAQVRQPLCPINGILTTLSYEVMQQVLAAKDMPSAINGDLSVIREELRLRCPITVLVTGMDKEPGFFELVRRVGANLAKTRRFGKGYDVWNPPTAENIDAFSAHACGAFEDWTYTLFREHDGLNKPGNAKLYTLLCKIRSHVQVRLRSILLHGYSNESREGAEVEKPLLFNGCYFAATGETEDRQAFVKNVFEKMLDTEAELEWTDDAWIADQRYHRLAQVGMVIDSLLVVSFIALVVWTSMR